MKKDDEKRSKPGPKEESLVIDEDPEEALDRLLRKPRKPPEPDDDQNAS